MKVVKRIQKIMDHLNKAVNGIAMISLSVCTLTAFVNTFARYILNHPFRWSEELCVLTLVWLVFCSLPYLEQENDHLNMTVLYNALPEKGRLVVNLLRSSITALLAGFLAKIGMDVVMRNYSLNINTQVFNWPYWIIYMIIPIVFILIIPTRLVNPTLKDLNAMDALPPKPNELPPADNKGGETS